MKRFQAICSALLITVWFPLAAAAPEDVSATTDEDTAQDVESSSSETVMLQQTSLVDGFQPITVAGQEIDATYLEETLGTQHGAIVLLHDQGSYIDSQGVITSLRHQLPEYGWSTLTLGLDFPFESNIFLSVALENNDSDAASEEELTAQEDEPVAAELEKTEQQSEATDEGDTDSSPEKDSLPPISNLQRMEAALEFLKAKGTKRIVFLGHGAGGMLAVDLLGDIKTPVSALILLGTPALPTDDIFNPMRQPIFDVYGDNDIDGVAEGVKHRKTLMKRAKDNRYQARKVFGADHGFYGIEPILASIIRGWLKTTFVEKDKK